MTLLTEKDTVSFYRQPQKILINKIMKVKQESSDSFLHFMSEKNWDEGQ